MNPWHHPPHCCYSFQDQKVTFCSKSKYHQITCITSINYEQIYLHLGKARGNATFTGLTDSLSLGIGPGELSIQIGSSLLIPRVDISQIMQQVIWIAEDTRGWLCTQIAWSCFLMQGPKCSIAHAQTVRVVTQIYSIQSTNSSPVSPVQ